MMENPEVKRKEEKEERLLVKDEDLEAIFKALGPDELIEEMVKFYGQDTVTKEIPLRFIVHTIHFRYKELGFWNIWMLLTDLQEQIYQLLWDEARKG